MSGNFTIFLPVSITNRVDSNNQTVDTVLFVDYGSGYVPTRTGLVTGGTGVPAVVLAAVVHGELLALTPFGAGDGVIARAAARLVLITRGLDPKAVSVPEVGHLELRQDYGDALAGYLSGTPDGVGAWLRHCCLAAELGAREGLAVCEAFQRG